MLTKIVGAQSTCARISSQPVFFLQEGANAYVALRSMVASGNRNASVDASLRSLMDRRTTLGPVTVNSPNREVSHTVRCVKPSLAYPRFAGYVESMDDDLQDWVLVPDDKGRVWRGGCRANSVARVFFFFSTMTVATGVSLH